MRLLILHLIAILGFVVCGASADERPSYKESNRGFVSFDVSMPIDASGFTLHGKNLTGGDIEFTSRGQHLTPRLAQEKGAFQLPVVLSVDDKPLITTSIEYDAIKFIAPLGIDNLFVKVGTAQRTQKVSGLDPDVLKDGTYTWRVPFFAAGKESDTVDGKSRNFQFMQVGTTGGPASSNVEYTQEFYLYTKADGNAPISGHPQETIREEQTLATSRSEIFTAQVHGLWGSGGADPYRKVVGPCTGSATTFPAGPHLDYEYGTFRLPTVLTPWNATPEDHCIINGKRHAGCTEAKINSEIHYTAQKIRVPLDKGVTLFAQTGSLYRKLMTDNLRYEHNNVYLKDLLAPDDYLKKSYLPGGYTAPFFAVGYEVIVQETTYSARYIYIPGAENSNRLAWRDASDTQIYAVGESGVELRPPSEDMRKALQDALVTIRKTPGIVDTLGGPFFTETLERNKISPAK